MGGLVPGPPRTYRLYRCGWKTLDGDGQRARTRNRILGSWSLFGDPVRGPALEPKDRRDAAPGDGLAVNLGVLPTGLRRPVDLILPAPFGKKRTKERGYNQLSLIAPPLALAARIAFVREAPDRGRPATSQVGWTKSERRPKVSGAFLAKGKRAWARIFLLMDDLATTGSTPSSCAEAFYAAGARDVFGLAHPARRLARDGVASRRFLNISISIRRLVWQFKWMFKRETFG